MYFKLPAVGEDAKYIILAVGMVGNLKVKEPSKTRPDFINDSRADEIETITRNIFGTTPSRVAFPGGKSRSVFIAEVSGGTYVFAKRGNKYDAKVEAVVLETLSPSGLVPAFIARSGKWVVQECIIGQRLPILIDEETDKTKRATQVAQALESLVKIQAYARETRLQTKVPRLGVVDKWIEKRIGAVDKISGLIGIDPPVLERDQIKTIFDVRQTDFVKWDSRPGNALIKEEQVYWFDWEDCGRRCSLDDIVCMMSDEWTNISANAEDALLKVFIPKFAGHMSEESAHRYFQVAACLQISFRLRLAMEYYDRDKKWWKRDYCLKGDKVGVTPQEVGRLCARMERWSKDNDILRPYGDWAARLTEKLDINT